MRKTLLGGLVAVALGELASALVTMAYAQTVPAGPAVLLPANTIIAARQTGYDLQAGLAAGFDKAAEKFWTEADKLAVLTDADDEAGFAAQFTTTTQACAGCHRAYRVRTN